jgi:hypothetical protein
VSISPITTNPQLFRPKQLRRPARLGYDGYTIFTGDDVQLLGAKEQATPGVDLLAVNKLEPVLSLMPEGAA